MEPGSPASSNRGFWIVASITFAISAVVLVALFANRGLKNEIGLAQERLREALDAADLDPADPGSFASALAEGLEASGDVRYVEGSVASDSLDVVSVSASEGVWAASIQARPGACFHIKEVEGGRVTYGVGEVCTGEAALSADQDEW